MGATANAVEEIFPAVDVANFIAVMGWDGNFSDFGPDSEALDENIGVEVKIIGVEVEGYFFKGLDSVGAVASVEFAQVSPEHAVFDSGEHLVAEPFVERHAAGEGVLFAQHAGAEHHIGIFVEDGGEDLGQEFWRVLTVAVKKDDGGEALLDGELIAKFLVAAVAEIFGVFENTDRDGAGEGGLLADRESVVGRGIINDDDLAPGGQTRVGDAFEHAFEMCLRIVGDDEDEGFCSLLAHGFANQNKTQVLRHGSFSHVAHFY